MKTFILGLGAQKAGTTWLHAYFSGLDGVDLGFAKEYRAFDPHTPLVQADRYLRAARKVLAGSLSGKGSSPETLEWKFLLNRRLYYDYFAGLLEQPGVSTTGDISPAYSGLKAPVLRTIRDNFARREITVRPMFLMRDPVERCWSAVRMERRNFVERPHRRKSVSPRQMALSEEEHLLELYRAPRFAAMTRYDLTVAEIEKAFGPDAAAYAFFEQLFKEATVKELCDKLRLGYKSPQLERPVNVSEKKREISDGTKAKIARFYEPVYAFAAGRYGDEHIARIWSSYRFVA